MHPGEFAGCCRGDAVLLPGPLGTEGPSGRSLSVPRSDSDLEANQKLLPVPPMSLVVSMDSPLALLGKAVRLRAALYRTKGLDRSM